MLIYHQTKIALGCETTLVLNVNDDTNSQPLFDELWLSIFRFEQRFSRFLPASELSQFNAHAGTKQSISEEFQDILTAAKDIGLATEGLYNPFILPALQRAGYKQSMVAAHKDDHVDDYRERSLTSIDKLEIGTVWARIPYGTALDLGGCGKGYIADRLSAQAEAFPELNGYWFSLGGDIIANGIDADNMPWGISVEVVGANAKNTVAGYAQNEGNRIIAVATSAITARKGVQHGKPWHHIIDPTTGQPATTDTLAASIQAESAFLSDVLASCVIIAGSHASTAFMKRYPIDGVLLQTVDHRIKAFGTLHQQKNAPERIGAPA